MGKTKKPVNGTRDITPAEMELREYLIKTIKDTYHSFGFSSIETPCVENISNLTSKLGGDNEKLIFKILKRGEKLKLEQAKCEDDLVDMGLRYDLTVPLVRYYANNESELTTPFKSIQIGNVWRADRPQKGRFRQFMQCDIDILGEDSKLAEIELILATTKAMGNIGFKGFTVRINDRRLLKAMAIVAGFDEDDLDKVFIALDKLDKIGLDNVRAELMDKGLEVSVIDRYLEIYDIASRESIPLDYVNNLLLQEEDKATIAELADIIDAVRSISDVDFNIVFDPSLVRGMSYYTGTIFEIEIDGFSGSIGGGGRYDKMVGSFLGQNVPACGFSIGFERIMTILRESNYTQKIDINKKAYLIEKNMPVDKMKMILDRAWTDRMNGDIVSLYTMKKNKRFQKDSLKMEGYSDIIEFYSDTCTNL